MKYLIDIDGTLLNGSEPINDAVQFINFLNLHNQHYLLMTNSIKSREIQFLRLKNAGLNILKEQIINPIVAINEYIRVKDIKRVKVIGSDAEIQQINVENDNEDYEVVILLDFEKNNVGYNIIQELVNDIENGKEIITASLSTFYLKNGTKAVDTGAFVKLLECITNKNIQNFGKPSMTYFTIAGNILNENKANIYVIGDDWSTDIVGANEYGAKSILVKTGKYIKNDETKCKPYKIISSFKEIEEASNN